MISPLGCIHIRLPPIRESALCFASYRYFLRWSFVRYQCFSIKTVFFDLFPVFSLHFFWLLSLQFQLFLGFVQSLDFRGIFLQIANCMVIFRVCLLLFCVSFFLAFIIGISIPTAKSPTVGLLSFLVGTFLGWNPLCQSGSFAMERFTVFTACAHTTLVTTGKSPIRFLRDP